ncbi:hypothetical protein NG42_06220 [Winslowiella iniecta]|uniref:Uncharacterized protein n=2 Tax=Winslowiella iniecta TaxID=1560201 RepID=A0A0L7T6R1_9GAMM|nr:hypothetical protein NG42_06220 [Winslowiella iniecta]
MKFKFLDRLRIKSLKSVAAAGYQSAEQALTAVGLQLIAGVSSMPGRPALMRFARVSASRMRSCNLACSKNAIHAAKNEFSKEKYLKNLFQYNTFLARIWVLPGQVAWQVKDCLQGSITSKRQEHEYHG